MTSGVKLIRDYFGGVRPVAMDEMKKLTSEDRTELADAIAKELGLKKIPSTDGTNQYE